eukprot:3324553-Lingulodinium_polyedra.AAC.1
MKEEEDPERTHDGFCKLITKYTARHRQTENRERQHRSLASPNTRRPVETATVDATPGQAQPKG